MNRSTYNINSTSLFHYTKKFSVLKSIIKTGLRYSYSYESLYNEFNLDDANSIVSTDANKSGVAIPMVCFCDIPILRAEQHKKKYGSYAIGLDKENLISVYKQTLNPINYISSNNHYGMMKYFLNMNTLDLRCEEIINMSKDEHYKQLIQEGNMKAIYEDAEYIKKIDNIVKKDFYTSTLLGFTKPYSYINEHGNEVCNYDEREWRIIIWDELHNETNWEWDISKEFFSSNYEIWNKEIEESEDNYIDGKYYKDINELIKHIIVNKDKEIVSLVRFIENSPAIFGCAITKDEKATLISKITSFERIKKDY